MRFGILRTKTVAGANVGGLILGTATFSLFLMLTLYMQQVLGYSPMKTGVAYLAVAGSAILWSAVAAQLVNRVGVKPVLVTGMVALTSGLVYFTQVSVHGTYLGDLLPGFLLVGVGLGFSFVPVSIAALAGIRPAEAGLASGLFNTTQQIGGALGIALLSTIATTRTSHALADGTGLPSALVHGFTGAFAVGAGIAAIGILAALTLIRRDELAQAPNSSSPCSTSQRRQPAGPGASARRPADARDDHSSTRPERTASEAATPGSRPRQPPRSPARPWRSPR